MDLKNTYWLLRHGHSLANAQDIVISSLEEGIKPQWGLSESGRQQAINAGHSLKEKLQDPSAAAEPQHKKIIFCSSPFSRTLETAALAASPFAIHQENTDQFIIAHELRERYFGEYELKPSENSYDKTWENDAQDTNIRPPGNGESVDDVVERMHVFIDKIESGYSECDIVVVSHGDALSILASVLLKSDLRNHRQHGLPNCGIFKYK